MTSRTHLKNDSIFSRLKFVEILFLSFFFVSDESEKKKRKIEAIFIKKKTFLVLKFSISKKKKFLWITYSNLKKKKIYEQGLK